MNVEVVSTRRMSVTGTRSSYSALVFTDPTVRTRGRLVVSRLRWSAAAAAYCGVTFCALAVTNTAHLWPVWAALTIAALGVALSNAIRLNSQA